MKNKFKTQLIQGFSLIELLVTVAIIAIIMSIAIPSYQQYLQKTYRSEAILNLEKIAAQQEKFKYVNNQYANNINELNFQVSSDDYYRYDISHLSADTGCQNDGVCFILTAVAQKSPQINDQGCTELTLEHTGRRLPLDCFE